MRLATWQHVAQGGGLRRGNDADLRRKNGSSRLRDSANSPSPSAFFSGARMTHTARLPAGASAPASTENRRAPHTVASATPPACAHCAASQDTGSCGGTSTQRTCACSSLMKIPVAEAALTKFDISPAHPHQRQPTFIIASLHSSIRAR